MSDPRTPDEIREDHARADKYASVGTLKHFLLRMGFFPDNEEVAEAILRNIIRENEWMRERIEAMRGYRE